MAFNPHILDGNKMFIQAFDRHRGEVFVFDYWYEVLNYDDGNGNLLDQICPRIYAEFKR